MSVTRKLFRKLAIVAVTLVVLCGLLLGGFQLAVTRVPQYRVQLQDWLQERTGLAIEFRELSARLRMYGPELVFKGLIVRTPDRTRVLVTARRGSVGLDVWESLDSRKLRSGKFTLEMPEIGLIRTREGKIQLIGQSSLPDRNKPFAIEQLPAGSFHVREAVVSFRDEATGRGPWALSGVSFSLDRSPGILNLRGSASLPAALGKSLRFAALVQGDLAKADSLLSSFSVNGDEIDLAGWADMLPDGWPAPDSGHGALQVSAAFYGSVLANLSAKVDLHSITAVAPAWSIPLPQADPLRIPEPEPVANHHRKTPVVADTQPEATAAPAAELISYQRIAFALHARRNGEAWETTVKDLDLSRPEAPWQSQEIQARWTSGAPGALDVSGKADRVVLANLWPLLAYLPESGGAAHLRALHAQGVIDGLAFTAKRGSAEEPLHYSLNAGLHDLGVRPVLKAPGIEAISGDLRLSEAEGEFKLDSRAVRFNFPSVFRDQVQLRSLAGRVAWAQQADGWRISSDELKLDGVDGQIDAAVALTLPRNGASPLMDLRAKVRNIDATATSRYLPANKLTAKTLEWFDGAFTAGRVVAGDVVLKGPLRSFPFRKRDGEFVARAQVEGITFNYQQGWTSATQLTGDVEFRNEGMSAKSITAQVGELRIHGTQGQFPDFHKGELAINANASGDFGQALSFLRASPVGPALGPLFQKLRGNGPIESKVSLWIPLQRVADRRLNVVTQFTDAAAKLEDVDAPLTALNGSLTVQQSLISGAELSGHLLGGPVAIRITPESATSAKLSANGHALATSLTPFMPPVVKIWGSTDWTVDTHIRTGQPEGTAQNWEIGAAMDGLGVGMPYPLGKIEQGARPLHADLEISNTLLARASYGDVRALLRMQRTGDRWAFDRGGVRADGLVAALPAHRGLRIEGDVDRIVLDDWFALRGAPSESNAAGGAKVADFLQAANVRIGELTLYGYQWADVRGVLQATDTGWRVDVAGPDTSGQVQIPASFTGDEPLSANMERLVLQQKDSEPATVAPKSDRDPRAWPNLRVHVADLRFDGHGVGDIELKATRVATGLQIDSVKVTQDHALAEANGQWLLTPEGERSSLALKIVSSDVGATLKTLNYNAFVEARRGEVRADLSWNGGFDGNILAHASGTLTVDGEAGQLSSLQPGAGRVLGLFSVAALPRRLALDFKDLTEKGLSFDTVHGDFDMREGNAYTTNLTLRGPAAEIGIAGRTGLGTHDYDQTAVVTGNLGASLPVAGVLAGGPAIGAALLLFTQVFKEPLKGITRGYYRITGSWDDPIVERVEAAAIKEAATGKLLVR